MVPSRLRTWPWAVVAAPCVALLLSGAAPPQAAPPQKAPSGPSQRLAAVEARVGGRLGVAAIDTGNGRRIEYRAGERFALCSTFKVLLAAAVLARVDSREESLGRRLAYGPADLLEYAPVTKAHLAEGGLPVSALCAAAVGVSDNTAANLLLATIGGPQGLTRYVRGFGDEVTRLDRSEPALNANLPGDPRDTTTPAAMAADLEKLVLGRVLSRPSREQLLAWLAASKTGGARLRAGFPPTWRVVDKTGTGANGATNDVAIAWHPGRSPIVVAAYLTDSSAPLPEREAALAEVGRIVGSDPSLRD